MPSTLRSPVVANVLRRLHAQADDEDSLATQRVRAREVEIGHRLAQDQRYELYGEAPLSITPEVGQLLYLLALSTRPRQIVESVARSASPPSISPPQSATVAAEHSSQASTTRRRSNLHRRTSPTLVSPISSSCAPAMRLTRWRTSPSRSTWCSSTGATTSTCRSFASLSRVCCPLASCSQTSAPTIQTFSRTWSTSASRPAATSQ
jgi:hypothetical protein